MRQAMEDVIGRLEIDEMNSLSKHIVLNDPTEKIPHNLRHNNKYFKGKEQEEFISNYDENTF